MSNPVVETHSRPRSSPSRQRSTTNPKGDRLRQLRAFCYAAQEGGLSRAARRLNLTQPAISRHVGRLEEELDTQLFERRGPYIHLTEAGEDLLALAKPLVEGMDRLNDTFAERQTTAGHDIVKIAAGQVGALHILPEYFLLYRRQYPDVKLTLKPVGGREGLARLRAYEVDFFVGAMEVVPDDLEYRPFVACDLVLITPLDHPLARRRSVTPHEATRYPTVLPPVGTDTRGAVDAIARQLRLEIDDVLETEGYDVIKRYVEAGIGISTVPSICVRETDRVAVVQLEETVTSRTYGVITIAGRPLSRAAARFVALLGVEIPPHA